MSISRVTDKPPLIFDLDGTLIDSRPEIIQTYQSVFREIVPPSPPDFERMDFGTTIQSFLERIYGNELSRIKLARDRFISIYDNSSFDHTPLYESVVETLNELYERGHMIYLVTNKRHAPTKRILERKKIAGYFSDIMATEMSPGVISDKVVMLAELKRRNAIHAGYMIGDTATDIIAGRKHKLTTVAVTYGYEPGNVADQNPDYIINSISELSKLVS